MSTQEECTKPVFLNIKLIHMHLCPYVRSIILLYDWSIMLSNIISGSYCSVFCSYFCFLFSVSLLSFPGLRLVREFFT
jgi:hypothetical protein